MGGVLWLQVCSDEGLRTQPVRKGLQRGDEAQASLGAWVNHAPKKTGIPRASGLVRELLVFSNRIPELKCLMQKKKGNVLFHVTASREAGQSPEQHHWKPTFLASLLSSLVSTSWSGWNRNDCCWSRHQSQTQECPQEEGVPPLETGNSSEEPSLPLGLHSCLISQNGVTC